MFTQAYIYLYRGTELGTEASLVQKRGELGTEERGARYRGEECQVQRKGEEGTEERRAMYRGEPCKEEGTVSSEPCAMNSDVNFAWALRGPQPTNTEGEDGSPISYDSLPLEGFVSR